MGSSKTQSCFCFGGVELSLYYKDAFSSEWLPYNTKCAQQQPLFAGECLKQDPGHWAEHLGGTFFQGVDSDETPTKVKQVSAISTFIWCVMIILNFACVVIGKQQFY